MEIEGAPAEEAGTEPLAAGETRRRLAKRLLGVGLGSAAVALVPQIAGRAGATTPPGTGAGGTAGSGGTAGTGGTTPAAAASTTSTTALPKRPTDADVDLLTFAQEVELAAWILYEKSLDLSFTDDQRTVVEVVYQSHLSYGQALSGFLGREASNDADQRMISEREAAFSGDVRTMLQAAYDLESTLVATHVELIGQLVGTDGANLMASIVTVEARNSTVFADLLGSTDLSVLLVENEADALTPVKG